MDSAKPASELIEISMKKAIESQTNARDKLFKEKEEFIKEKELWNAKYIKIIISRLGSIIEKNPTDSSKWYYDVLIDKNALMRRIDTYTKEVNSMEKYPDSYVRVDEQIHEFKMEISVAEKTIKYMDLQQLKASLDELQYKLEEIEVIVNTFWCIPSYKRVIHRISCKVLHGSLGGVMIKN
jgi:hypothetical protein